MVIWSTCVVPFQKGFSSNAALRMEGASLAHGVLHVSLAELIVWRHLALLFGVWSCRQYVIWDKVFLTSTPRLSSSEAADQAVLVNLSRVVLMHVEAMLVWHVTV
jgi:hypothetical protein